MGVVYKATDAHLDRPVALKVLRPELVGDAERNRRFQQEAKAASALNHPNIVHVYDIASDGGVDFIAMEFVEGQTLDRLIGRGLKTGAALDYAIQVADALAAAHARGIVHRDIKPSNIIVNSRGAVKVLDFGIAKLLRGEEQGSSTTRTVLPHTEQGVVIGTAAYMSPEQTEGREVGPQADIFSFGAVLFEMLTGRRAFEGNTNLAIASAILHTEPPQLRELIPTAAPELERTIARCLRKDSSKRTQHMIDVKLALEELKDERASHAAVRKARHNSWRWALVGVAALIGLPGLLMWRTSNITRPEVLVTPVPLTTLPGLERYPSLSPDGKSVVFSRSSTFQGDADIYVQLIGSGNPLQLTSSPGVKFNPVWSPDGKTIAFLRASVALESAPPGHVEVWQVPALGGTQQKLGDLEINHVMVRPTYLAWCPHNDCLIATDSQGAGRPDALFVFSRETFERRQLTHPDGQMSGDNNPAVSPDGRWLAFRRTMLGLGSGQIFVVALSSDVTAAGEAISVTPGDNNDAFPAWLPDSKEIVYTAGRYLWRVRVPARGQPMQLAFGEDGLMPTIATGQNAGSARLVYQRASNDSNIWRADMPRRGAAGTIAQITRISSTLQDFLGDLSPDGKRLAFLSRRSGSQALYVCDIDGSNLIQLTSIGGPTGPRWSPDGKLITFQADGEGGQKEIYTIPTTGGRPRVIAPHPENDFVSSFSRDGQSIYFSSMRSGDFEIWRVPVAGGDPEQITHGGGFLPFESADRTELFYLQSPAKPIAFRRKLTDDSPPKRMFDGVVFGALYVADRGIYFVDTVEERSRLQYYDLEKNRATTVVDDLGTQAPGLLAGSRDGRLVLFSRFDSQNHDLMLVDNFK